MTRVSAWFVLGLLPFGNLCVGRCTQGRRRRRLIGGSEIRRGEKLATFGGCHDCHTPKVMTPRGRRRTNRACCPAFPGSRYCRRCPPERSARTSGARSRPTT